MSQQLCLRWNNHGSAFEKLLSSLQMKDIYSDGTILCEGKFYPIHRFVLSTCSEYFEEMFSQCARLSNKHPFIIVKDIHSEQMEALLSYMYKGEVNVPQEMLPELIKAAEVFKIKGLAVPDEEPSSNPSRKRFNVSSPSSISKRSRRYDEKSSNINPNLYDEDDHIVNNSDDSEINKLHPSTSNTGDIIDNTNILVEIKSEPKEVQELDQENSKVKKEQQYSPFPDDYSSNVEAFDFNASNENFDDPTESTSTWDDSQSYEREEIDEDNPSQRPFDNTTSEYRNDEQISRKDTSIALDTSYKTCPYCPYKSRFTTNMTTHIRKHTGEKPFQCPQCSFRSAQKNNIDRHVKAVHLQEKPHSCPQCSYRAARKGDIRLHLSTVHGRLYEPNQ